MLSWAEVTSLFLQVADVYIEGAQMTGFLPLAEELSYFLAMKPKWGREGNVLVPDWNTGDASCLSDF